METVIGRRREVSPEPTGPSKNIDDILAQYTSEPEDVTVITSAPQDVGQQHYIRRIKCVQN